MKAARFLIADDHEIVREGICTIVRTCEGFEVRGEASDSRQAVQLALTIKPDIVVVDIGMPRFWRCPRVLGRMIRPTTN
jgi:DNA-binding NarL/FixJ family response regulator